MPSYTALIAQRRVRAANGSPVYESLVPTMRVACVTQVRATQDTPGGWIEGEFTIPAERARHGLHNITAGEAIDHQVWIMDGLSVVFHGFISKIIPQPSGDLDVWCDGDYVKLADTYMRTIFSDTDLSVWTPSPGSTQAASQSVDAQGRLVFAFPKSSTFDAGDYVAADYLAFGETIGNRDGKTLDAWKITLGSASTWPGSASIEFRIYGLSGPGDTTPTLLQSFSAAGTRTEVSDHSSGDNTLSWTNSGGYRCFRMGLWATGSFTAATQDKTAVVTNMAVSTRGRTFGLTTVPSTTKLAKEVWVDAAQGYDLHAYMVSEYVGESGTITGNIADSGQKAAGVSYKDWSTPQEIVEGSAALDGYKVGMWGPSRNPWAGHLAKAGNTTINPWYRQPAELVYEQWNDLGDPDYHVRLSRGAVWQPDGQPDDVVSAVYVQYQSLTGRPLSVFSEDASTENVVYEQGLHKAANWVISPSVDTQTAQTIGSTYVQLRRQPALSGTLTLYGDRPGSIEFPGGAKFTRLSAIRPGVVRIVDSRGAKSGRITRIEYTARNAQNPEMAVIQVNSPAAQYLDLQTARLAKRAAHHRHR